MPVILEGDKFKIINVINQKHLKNVDIKKLFNDHNLIT
jgi:hypothetical protein